MCIYCNTSGKFFSGKVSYELYDRDNRLVLSTEKRLSVGNEHAAKVASRMKVDSPHLWSPDSPYLYQLHVYVKDKAGSIVDGYRRIALVSGVWSLKEKTVLAER